jgi:hypothetical protein
MPPAGSTRGKRQKLCDTPGSLAVLDCAPGLAEEPDEHVLDNLLERSRSFGPGLLAHGVGEA